MAIISMSWDHENVVVESRYLLQSDFWQSKKVMDAMSIQHSIVEFNGIQLLKILIIWEIAEH